MLSLITNIVVGLGNIVSSLLGNVVYALIPGISDEDKAAFNQSSFIHMIYGISVLFGMLLFAWVIPMIWKKKRKKRKTSRKKRTTKSRSRRKRR